MSDTISRAKAIEEAEEWIEAVYCDDDEIRERMAIKQVINGIKELPPAQPERIKGHWTVKEGELSFWDVCSVCRKMIIHRAPHYSFCPHCGAKMEREVTT